CDQQARRRPRAGPAAAAPAEETQAHPEGPDPAAARAPDSRHHRVIALIQRVTEAAVVVDGETLGAIGAGILALVGVERGDTEVEAARLAERVLAYRVFSDGAGKMNRSLVEAGGSLL